MSRERPLFYILRKYFSLPFVIFLEVLINYE